MTSSAPQIDRLRVVALSGGVGGAKLVDGLARILPHENLSVIVNTGDDFEHLGLLICPDLDTVMYTLAGVANPETGWGRDGESWRTIEEVGRLQGPEWFRLGDLDLATHLLRADMLSTGATLTEITRELCRKLGVYVNIMPMSNQLAPTIIDTDEGEMSFQSWFVEKRWQPPVRRVSLPEDVRATPQVLAALENADLVILTPSNPFVSIDPILNVYPIKAAIVDLAEMVVAISPIIAGRAVKGPAAKMMYELGMEVSSSAVAGYYGDLIDLFVCDHADAQKTVKEGPVYYHTSILMKDSTERRRLAEEVLRQAMQLISQ